MKPKSYQEQLDNIVEHFERKNEQITFKDKVFLSIFIVGFIWLYED